MSKYISETLSQQFELRSYKVFFDIKDSLQAEETLDTLDKSTKSLMQIFGLTNDPVFEVYLHPNFSTIERVTQKPLAVGENQRIIFDDNALLLSVQNPPKSLGAEAVRALSYIIFNKGVKEREIGIRQWRTPSWLREGICHQISARIGPDSQQNLLNAWGTLQEAQKVEQLIKPNLMMKSVHLIPDPTRRALAVNQSFFMARLLLTIYCDKFFNRYSTLMGALEDMDAQAAFRQVTNFDYDKFFSLFKDWVRTENAWVAISD